jgi:hypothetical protein
LAAKLAAAKAKAAEQAGEKKEPPADGGNA